MKIFMLGDGGSSHIEKWVKGLCENQIEVGLFSLHAFDENLYKGLPGFTILNNPSTRSARSLFSKLSYLKNTRQIRKKLDRYKPDVLHAHYATSYGLLATKTHFHPLIISVWGTDVYDFPRTSFVHKQLLQSILSKADLICSTSHCMKDEAALYTSKKIEVVPFGVDTDVFAPSADEQEEKEEFIIGTIKSLEKKYGIDLLIRAFTEVLKIHPKKKFRLLIVGDGSKRTEYEKLCEELKITDKVTFTGRVNHTDVPKYHRQIDVFVSLSIVSESFGVSLVEAMACGKPVVASDVAGFKEVIGDDGCGILVPKYDYHEAAKAISEYIKHPKHAASHGKKARARVVELYDWKKNLEQMIAIYRLLG